MIAPPPRATSARMPYRAFILYHYDWQPHRTGCRQMKCLHTMLRRRRRQALVPRQAAPAGRALALCVWRSGLQRRLWLELTRQDKADREVFLWRQRSRRW